MCSPLVAGCPIPCLSLSKGLASETWDLHRKPCPILSSPTLAYFLTPPAKIEIEIKKSPAHAGLSSFNPLGTRAQPKGDPPMKLTIHHPRPKPHLPTPRG